MSRCCGLKSSSMESSPSEPISEVRENSPSTENMAFLVCALESVVVGDEESLFLLGWDIEIFFWWLEGDNTGTAAGKIIIW
ncbi:unnamed protein product [Microthlaspi erraticum]|uniref:Uncharacterized protein n=1 Tax=Microthlaspi erraticum TaxID=1685480 RepID=A0A6D2IL65_9BRAS|nr:unnamed protein product [Microthlaspi erraticum]